MENNQQKEAFHYTYSAREQEEIKSIRKKYIAAEEDKMATLRRLDQGVTKKGTMTAIVAGVIGTLILGTGMSCIMTFGGVWFVPGIVIGVIGLAVTAAAYPLYLYITKKEREKIAPEILRLTEELLK